MSGSLVRRITAASQAGYGINILDVDEPSGVQGVGETTVGVVGDFPWGLPDTVTDIASVGELFAAFCPVEFGALDTYTPLKAFLNKSFSGGLKVVRIDATNAAKATHTFADGGGSPAPSLDVTAKYKGALGNRLKVAILAGSSGSKRSVTVSIGSTYSKTYLDVVDATVVTDPGDPFVTFAAHSGIALPPAVIVATSLTGGADGTAVAADFSGTAPAYDGIRAFYPKSQKIGALFVADPTEALKDDINAALLLYATDTRKGIVIYCTIDGQSATDAEAYAADLSDDDKRGWYPYPRVKTINSYDPNRAEIEVDGQSWAAAACVSVDPEISPGGASGARALQGITGVEAEFEDSVYDALRDAGVAPFFMSSELGGCIVAGAMTTNTTGGTSKISRRRMTDFLEESIAGFMVLYQERPLDVQLSPPALGPVTSQEVGSIEAFLEGLKTGIRIEDYSVDPFGANLQADLDAGVWTLAVWAKLWSDMDDVILKMASGPSVAIPTRV